MNLVESKGLSFAHPEASAIHFPDFELKEAESLLILGKSGSGKTTLLNLLAGLLKPDTGKIVIQQKEINSFSAKEMDSFRGRYIGLIFQKPHLLAPLSVKENLEVAPYFSSVKGEDSASLLKQLQIGDKANSSVKTLSEGEAQRVSIARALMNKPKVILADEPTSSLDDENAQIVIDLLKSQAERIGASLIVVTHDQRVKEQIPNFIQVGAS